MQKLLDVVVVNDAVVDDGVHLSVLGSKVYLSRNNVYVYEHIGYDF